MFGPELVCEGKNDEHVIGHLLFQHNIKPADFQAESRPNIKYAGDDFSVLKLVTRVKLTTQKHIGFVIDADDSVGTRVSQVCDRLDEVVKIDRESFFNTGAFVQQNPMTGFNIGVWIMPGESDIGNLEDFMLKMVPEGDLMLPIAKKTIEEAKEVGPRFSNVHSTKALVHVWLGLQKQPGLPLGSATRAKYFDSNFVAATKFIDWFRILFQVV